MEELKQKIIGAISQASSIKELEELRVQFFGKTGEFSGLMKNLGKLDPSERAEQGKVLNVIKAELEALLNSTKKTLEEKELNEKLKADAVDITLPVRDGCSGTIHPISQVYQEIVSIFGKMGFSVAEGPELEDQFHNFNALNMPANHPARQMQDTFYVKNPNSDDADENYVVRTHTSPVQIRTMEKGDMPIRIIAPGRTYRSDSDATHSPMFHQVEGLVIDKNITFANLKHCLHTFLKEFFELDDVPLRYRPSFFPFTEPSAEIDIACKKSKDELKIGAGTDWLEILGCGMVHPNVLRAGGIDPDVYQGFAFGVGIDRLAMLKYGIPDLRTFFESDLRWLKNYGFSPIGEVL
ncbi:MAG: phenylalanine--tRNA ligase subunit alpha [Alphaproteobacteria bacterium]